MNTILNLLTSVVLRQLLKNMAPVVAFTDHCVVNDLTIRLQDNGNRIRPDTVTVAVILPDLIDTQVKNIRLVLIYNDIAFFSISVRKYCFISSNCISVIIWCY